MIHDPQQLTSLINEAEKKSRSHQDRLPSFFDDLLLLTKMAKVYRNKEYRELPWKVILLAVAALLYFVNPFDLIPDFLSIPGFIDDAAVVAMVVNALREEIDHYRKELRSLNSPEPLNDTAAVAQRPPA